MPFSDSRAGSVEHDAAGAVLRSLVTGQGGVVFVQTSIMHVRGRCLNTNWLDGGKLSDSNARVGGAILPHGCLAALLIFGRLHGFRSVVETLKDTVVNDRLTKDEFEALLQVSHGKKNERISACVARNAKRLTGLKYFRYGKDGELALTDKGQQTLFLKRCVDTLRAIAESGPMQPDTDVATFLLRKGHIAPGALPDRYDLTQRGRESLADIDLNSALPSA